MPATVTIDTARKQMTIKIDLADPPRPSKSGKTTALASTNGNVTTTTMYDGKPVVLGLNAYVK